MSDADLTLLVLAAGHGSRYGGLKQMEPVGPSGETLLDFAVLDAERAGFGRVVFVLGADFAENFEAQVAIRYTGRLTVHCVCQRLDDLPPGFAVPGGRRRPWGTLQAVWSARARLAGPFAVVNADDFYGRESYAAVARFFRDLASGSRNLPTCCMVGYRLDRTLSGAGGVNRGICTQHDGWLQEVVEHIDIVAEGAQRCTGVNPAGQRVAIAADALASMNFWGFTPAVLAPMEDFFGRFLSANDSSLSAECYLPDLINQLLANGGARCRVLPTPEAWFGLTHAADKARVVDALRAARPGRESSNSVNKP